MENTNEKFVVFLDILGFKDFIARNRHEDVYMKMLNLFEIKQTVSRQLNTNIDEAIDIISFSDSIIIFSKDDTIKSFETISIAAAFLMAFALEKSIPIKGAIAHGLLSVDKSKQIYIGQPLIDAYLLQEKEVNYYGVVCHNSIDKFLFNAKERANKDLYFITETPLKSGNINHRNLNWFMFLVDFCVERSLATEKAFDKLMECLATITSGAPRKYIDNTVKVFNSKFKNENADR